MSLRLCSTGIAIAVTLAAAPALGQARYLNIAPAGAPAAAASPPAAAAPAVSIGNRNAGRNNSNSSFCQEPIYDSWGNVTGYRQGGC